MLLHFEKFHVIHLWLGQHDALCDPNYLWCDPQLWHGAFLEHIFYFQNLENGLFQTHPPTKSG